MQDTCSVTSPVPNSERDAHLKAFSRHTTNSFMIGTTAFNFVTVVFE
jgi:hypothetical protein